MINIPVLGKVTNVTAAVLTVNSKILVMLCFKYKYRGGGGESWSHVGTM